jgi:hypothetical protein
VCSIGFRRGPIDLTGPDDLTATDRGELITPVPSFIPILARTAGEYLFCNVLQNINFSFSLLNQKWIYRFVTERSCLTTFQNRYP